MGNMATENAAGNRIEQLLDAGSFVEIGGAVTARTTDFNMQEKKTPADGVITGYGVIDGNLVYVYSQDASVLKGSIGEMHARKIANIYDMACISPIDPFKVSDFRRQQTHLRHLEHYI